MNKFRFHCGDITLPNVGTIPGCANSGVRDITECVDGTTLSVQASSSHYCTPRDNDGPYTHVEVWNIYATCAPYFPDNWSEKYGGGDGEPFGYVPVEEVAAFISAHGGLK